MLLRAGRRIVCILERRRAAQAVVVTVVSVLAGAVTVRTLAAARAAERSWVGDVPALLAVRSVERGASIGDRDVVEILLPPALAPGDVVSPLPEGARARVALSPRSVITTSVLDPSPRTPRGWRIVALPDDTPTPPLVLGDTVDVVAGDDAVAAGAIVVSLAPLSVAVPAAVAAVTATAARLGEVAIVKG